MAPRVVHPLEQNSNSNSTIFDRPREGFSKSFSLSLTLGLGFLSYNILQKGQHGEPLAQNVLACSVCLSPFHPFSARNEMQNSSASLRKACVCSSESQYCVNQEKKFSEIDWDQEIITRASWTPRLACLTKDTHGGAVGDGIRTQAIDPCELQDRQGAPPRLLSHSKGRPSDSERSYPLEVLLPQKTSSGSTEPSRAFNHTVYFMLAVLHGPHAVVNRRN